MHTGYQHSKVGNTSDMMLNYLKQTVTFGSKYLGHTAHAEDNQVFVATGEREQVELES